MPQRSRRSETHDGAREPAQRSISLEYYRCIAGLVGPKGSVMEKEISPNTKDLFGEFGDMDWNKELQPLFQKYEGRKHPLEYKTLYQLLVMVVLSARDSDRNINSLAPALFEKFPSIKDLAKAR